MQRPKTTDTCVCSIHWYGKKFFSSYCILNGWKNSKSYINKATTTQKTPMKGSNSQTWPSQHSQRCWNAVKMIQIESLELIINFATEQHPQIHNKILDKQAKTNSCQKHAEGVFLYCGNLWTSLKNRMIQKTNFTPNY